MRRKFSDEGVVLVLGPEWSARISAVANMCAASRDFPLCISGVIEPAVGFDRGAKSIADGTGRSGKQCAVSCKAELPRVLAVDAVERDQRLL